jgi:hypothetical protein
MIITILLSEKCTGRNYSECFHYLWRTDLRTAILDILRTSFLHHHLTQISLIMAHPILVFSGMKPFLAVRLKSDSPSCDQVSYFSCLFEFFPNVPNSSQRVFVLEPITSEVKYSDQAAIL